MADRIERILTDPNKSETLMARSRGLQMRLLTVREACERLRISRTTLYNLVKQGKLTFVKIGGKSLIGDDVIHRLIARGSRERPKRAARAGGTTWARLWEDLVRRGIVVPASRRAFLAPRLAPFRPIKAKGKPASEIITEERGER
jgi:excisionase family DNA binding protein